MSEEIKVNQDENANTNDSGDVLQEVLQRYTSTLSDTLKAAQILNHGYAQVLKAHNIKVDTDSWLDGRLTIKDGIPTGDIGYKPKSLVQSAQSNAVAAKPIDSGLSENELARMTPHEAVKRMGDIEKLMAKHR